MRNKVRCALRGGVSVLALGVLAAAASAQDTMETVVVTGMRASLQSAQMIKQNSEQVVDSITAVDIGALPDASVAEALQRVPGIQITRTNEIRDPTRWAAFGNGVMIRGLTYVNSLTNGQETFSANSGRTISFADISSSLMAGVDTYKSPSAKMIEGGIAGTIDLRTRKPFDRSDRVFAVAGDLTYGDISGKVAQSINGLYSDRWNTKIGEVGALISIDYQNMRASNGLVSLEPYDASATVDGDTVHYPWDSSNAGRGLIGYRRLDWTQPRVAVDATFQWRPSETLEFTLMGIYTKAEPQSVEHAMGLQINYTQAALASYKYNDEGDWIGGTINNAESGASNANFLNTSIRQEHHMTGAYTAGAKYTPNDRFQVTFNSQYVDSRRYMYGMWVYDHIKNNQWCQYSKNSNNANNCGNGTVGKAGTTFYPDAPVINVTGDFSTNTPKITYTGDVDGFGEQSNYLWASAMDAYENDYAHSWSNTADANYKFGDKGLLGWVRSVDFGYRSSIKGSTTRHSKYNYNRIGFQTWNVGYKSTYAPSVYTAALGDFSTKNASNTETYSMHSLFGTAMPTIWAPKASWLANPQAVWSGIQEVEAGLAAVGLNASLWTSLYAQANCTGVGYKCYAIYDGTSANSNNGGVNRQSETTDAAYAQVNFGHDKLFGLELPVDGNVGVRIVDTQTSVGGGYLMLPSIAAGTGVCATLPNAATCPDRTEAYNFVGNSGSNLKVLVDGVDNHYTDFLPSANLRFLLSDPLQIRLAYSRGMVRPKFSQLANYTSLSFAFDANNPGTFATLNGGKSGTGGNPNLKPMYSNNFDASLEWYIGRSSSLTIAGFYKDISNYFMHGVVANTYTRNGYTETFNVTRFQNGDKGTVGGFEIAYQQFFDMLPGAWSGVGVQANYTKIYNTGGHSVADNISDGTQVGNANNDALPMEGMSNDSFNAALMYEKYDLSARLAYNWRSRFLVSASALNLGKAVWQRNYGQLDGSFLYTLFDHYKVGLQASNILKQTTVLEVGTVAYHPPYEWVEGERKVSLVFRASW